MKAKKRGEKKSAKKKRERKEKTRGSRHENVEYN